MTNSAIRVARMADYVSVDGVRVHRDLLAEHAKEMGAGDEFVEQATAEDLRVWIDDNTENDSWQS